MNLKEFIASNSNLRPKEIIKKARLAGWNEKAMFEGLKETREYLNEENDKSVVVQLYNNLSLDLKFDFWLEARVKDIIRGL